MREFILETRSHLLIVRKLLTKLKTQIFRHITRKKTPSLVLKSVIEVYFGNKLKVKINNKLSAGNTINRGVRKGCPLSPAVFNM